MNPMIRIDLKGDRQVGLRFAQFPDDLYADLRTEIDALSAELYARIEAATPSRTGKLRSQERLRIFADKTRITGYVDIAGEKGSQDFAKAGAVEYGSLAKVSVRAHPMSLDHYWSWQLDRPVRVLVDAYARTANTVAAAFERGPLAAMQPEIVAGLNAVVERNAQKASQ